MDLGQTLMVQTSVDLTTMDMDMNMDLGQTLMALTSVDLTTMDMNMVLARTLMVQTSFLDQGLLDLTMVLDLDLVQTGVKLGIFEARRSEIVLKSIYQSIANNLISIKIK